MAEMMIIGLVDFDSVHVGHHQVEEDEFGLQGLQAREDPPALSEAGHLVTVPREDEGHEVDHIRIVFDVGYCLHLVNSSCQHRSHTIIVGFYLV